MKRIHLLVILISCAAAYAQTSDLFDKAPPDVDEALRARITIFYTAQVTGKYHDALKVVAEESLDDFMGLSKDTYKGCEISKIGYSDSFTKATAVTACKGEYRWHGNHMPVTIPLNSTWKLVDGQWYWYFIHHSEVETPWGISRTTPENSATTEMPSIPPDPAALARSILTKVVIDKHDVALKGYEASQGEVHITNNMPGPITVTVERLPVAGSSVKVEPAQVPAGGKATITFAYNPNDPSIACTSCVSKAALPAMSANVRISPTAQVFPVRVTFAVSPEVMKTLPKIPNQ